MTIGPQAAASVVSMNRAAQQTLIASVSPTGPLNLKFNGTSPLWPHRMGCRAPLPLAAVCPGRSR